METLQILENGVIIGGIGFVTYYYWDEIKLLFQGSKAVTEWYAGAVKGGVELAPTMVEGIKTGVSQTIDNITGTGTVEEQFQDKDSLAREIDDMRQEGNVMVDTIDALAGVVGINTNVGPKYTKILLESQLTNAGDFGDLSDPLLFRSRVWAGATLKDMSQRLVFTHHSIVMQREGNDYKGTKYALTKAPVSFHQSINHQYDLMDDEYRRYTLSSTTPADQDKNMASETFNHPGIDLYAHSNITGGTSHKRTIGPLRIKWVSKDDDDESTYLTGYTIQKSEPRASDGATYDKAFVDPNGKRIYIGYAGEFDMKIPNWRTDYEKDPSATTIKMVNHLNSLEIPATYHREALGSRLSQSEWYFLNHYGIEAKYKDTDDGLVHYRTRHATSATRLPTAPVVIHQPVENVMDKATRSIGRIFG